MKSHFEQTLRDMRAKEIENLRLKMRAEYDDKLQAVKDEYNERMQRKKKETRKILDQTVESMSKAYEDEIRILKKKNKESKGYTAELKRANLAKDGEIRLL